MATRSRVALVGVAATTRPFRRETAMKALIVSSAVIVCGGVLFGVEPRPTPGAPELAKRAAAIKPAPAELRWQEIPWVTDLAEGQRLAQAERRPIFLWVTGDDPLERC